MNQQRAFIAIAVLIVAGLGLRVYFQTQAPEAQKISQSAEGVDTPASAASPAISPSEKKTSPVDGKSPQALSASDLNKYGVLREILETKNDNDPRFDTDLKNLSPELKFAFERRHAEFAPEKRNERGTVAFLIAREISSPQDVEFLEKVLSEKTCLSLSDCNKSTNGETEEEKHLSGINEVTASYPQLTTIQQATARYQELQKDPQANPDLSKRILKLLETGQNSQNSRVAEAAKQALESLHR